MEEIIKKIPDVKIAADVLAGLLRELGGTEAQDDSSHVYIYLNEGGFRLTMIATKGSIYYTEGKDARFTYEAKND